MPCICGHEDHAFTEPTVCKDLSCNCEKFIEATPDNPVPPKWQSILEEYDTTKGKLIWLLDNIKFLRNYPNKQFVDWYRQKVQNVDPETVRRTKQKLVQNDSNRYGPFDAPELEMQKQLKQVGIEEWLVSA
ncbi:MAG: hypothetical protein ACR2P9_08700 [Gammaproteobacteria bacterium]